MRPLPLILLASLMLGCSSQPADDQANSAPANTSARQPVKVAPAAEPNLNQVTGTLLTPAAGSVVELAILLVDAKGQPRSMLESHTLSGTGQALPFTLSFAKPLQAPDLRLQLRARVSVSGRLVQRLPGQLIDPALNADLGVLQLVAAP